MQMMGASINGNASGSNPLEVGSNPTPPAIYNDKYQAAGIAAMNAYGDACMDAGKGPTRQGFLDAAVKGMTAAMTQEMVKQAVNKILDDWVAGHANSILTPNPAAPVYIDDASGA